MKYKPLQRKNPQAPQAAGKWYAAPVNAGTITQRAVSNEIVELSSLTRGDVSSVIDNLLVAVPKYLLMGNSVNLGSLGTFRLSFSSKGVDTPAEVNANLISGVKVIFTPSSELREKLRQAKFEKA